MPGRTATNRHNHAGRAQNSAGEQAADRPPSVLGSVRAPAVTAAVGLPGVHSPRQGQTDERRQGSLSRAGSAVHCNPGGNRVRVSRDTASHTPRHTQCRGQRGIRRAASSGPGRLCNSSRSSAPRHVRPTPHSQHRTTANASWHAPQTPSPLRMGAIAGRPRHQRDNTCIPSSGRIEATTVWPAEHARLRAHARRGRCGQRLKDTGGEEEGGGSREWLVRGEERP